jgi:hypothetical protein
VSAGARSITNQFLDAPIRLHTLMPSAASKPKE